MQFIREGDFVQKGGAATLRVVGDVAISDATTNVLVREKIVRESITDRDVLGNFLKQEKVHQPAAYILHSCHTAMHWLPVFYYVNQADLSQEEIFELVRREETTHKATRGILLDQLQGRRSAFTKPTLVSQAILQKFLSGTLPNAENLTDIRKHAIAIQGWTNNSFGLLKLLTILETLRAKVKTLSQDSDRTAEIRKAASWLDEFYFRER